MIHDQLRLLGSDPLNQTGAEVANDAIGGGGKALRKASDMQLAAIARIVLPLALDGQQLSHVNAGQGTNNGGQIIAKQPSTIIEAKTRNRIMIIFIPKDNTLDRSFKCWHTDLFSRIDAFYVRSIEDEEP